MDDKTLQAASTLVLFFLGALVIDRLAKNLILTLELLPAWTKRFSGDQAQKAAKLGYFIIALILGVGIAATVPKMNILTYLNANLEGAGRLLKPLVNGLVLMGGADVVKTLLGFLEDRRELGLLNPRPEQVEISIINQHEGAVEVRTPEGKVAQRRSPAAAEKGPH